MQGLRASAVVVIPLLGTKTRQDHITISRATPLTPGTYVSYARGPVHVTVQPFDAPPLPSTLSGIEPRETHGSSEGSARSRPTCPLKEIFLVLLLLRFLHIELHFLSLPS